MDKDMWLLCLMYLLPVIVLYIVYGVVYTSFGNVGAIVFFAIVYGLLILTHFIKKKKN